MQLTHLDLFSGIGGWGLAAKWAGIETLAFCEIDSFCQKVLMKHWPEVHIYSDIKKFTSLDGRHDGRQVDILTASMPCQPFSCAGKKKGKDDARYLFPDTLRVINLSRPTWIIFENVPGIIPYLDDILQELERNSYYTQIFNISASSIGAPHKRERIWIIANRDGKRCNKWFNYWKERYLQGHVKRYFSQIQSEWSQLIPQSWQTMQANDFLKFNAGVVRNDDGLSKRLDKDRIKSLGNAIVPQIAYVFFKIISEIEKSNVIEK